MEPPRSLIGKASRFLHHAFFHDGLPRTPWPGRICRNLHLPGSLCPVPRGPRPPSRHHPSGRRRRRGLPGRSTGADGSVAKGDGRQLLERARRARSDQRVDPRPASRNRRARVPHRPAVEGRQDGRRVLGPRRQVLALPESHLRRRPRRRLIIHIQILGRLVAFVQAPPCDVPRRGGPIRLQIPGREIRVHPHDPAGRHHAEQARRGVRARLARRDRDPQLAGPGARGQGAADGAAVRELADGVGGVGGWEVGDCGSRCSG